MGKGIFITGTGTDIGKTYVAALLIKKMRDMGMNTGYYKGVLSGAKNISESDAGYVNDLAQIGQEPETLVSYLYKDAVSPHLASKLKGNPVELNQIKRDFIHVSEKYDYVVVEGSGGIVCPIRYDDEAHIFLEDIIKNLELDTLIVANAGLGTINAVVLTVEYMRQKNIGIKGIIMNHYTGTILQKDNIKMIEALTGLTVISLVAPNDEELTIDPTMLSEIFKEK
ncbi:dethiobiotin synthase [Anaerotignum propionicum]|uniref:ATP-dependent dethiobiotin synthetase BioD n=1 Tax=Anaerotignum propionicum DSM 1682 TaxID=991789 RepID=A0A0X1U8C9_ANAPI|nr:dethiobiotin synthase [Anaerotignum propionicum]AMJ41194.1 ATP-dependent dethiobiotin synthetase BioD 1 [Anaerotignum propionicum DSM 1682]SHE65624.1 dethiobiotin synthetase [[Clostridium] propionicum DSM 1682] [Anaerotignum propionicum DSM 1682]